MGMNMCVSGDNLGYLFEHRVLMSLNQCGLFNQVWTEKDLVKRHGWPCVSADFLCVPFHGNMVCIQTKWKNTRRQENKAIHNFLRSLSYIRALYPDYTVVGLWVSRMEPFEDNKRLLDEHNVYNVSEYQCMHELVKKTVSILKSDLI
jgi:hypothetical protein